MKKLISTAVLLFITIVLFAQKPNFYVAEAKVFEGDTIPYIRLKEVAIFNELSFKNSSQARKYNRLVKHVKKVYPYAKLAGLKLQEYNDTLMKVTNEREKRRLMKQAEDELRADFEGDLKKLTFTQGTILIKLVDRETKFTSYELVQDLRGNVMAAFWQGFARIFKYNLKTEYDPENKDKYIERIVLMIEAGAI